MTDNKQDVEITYDANGKRIKVEISTGAASIKLRAEAGHEDMLDTLVSALPQILERVSEAINQDASDGADLGNMEV